MNRRTDMRLPGESEPLYTRMNVSHSTDSFPRAASGEKVGTMEAIFPSVRNIGVTETVVTIPGARGGMLGAMKQVRADGVDLCADPEIYDRSVWNFQIEDVVPFPIAPRADVRVRDYGFRLKRVFDIVFASLVLIFLSPILLVIAVAIILDSPGPVLYSSERIGKMGCVFRFFKFRTMVWDAEERRNEVIEFNERDSVLFKIAADPRVTRLGRFLRKYSLDELPQFFNVLCGDMSVVGPRPPLGSEVREYTQGHLRRLEVLPGITGLWQVQARQDHSFENYISLDLAYIEWWSIWLDLKIILRTIGIVFDGTGC